MVHSRNKSEIVNQSVPNVQTGQIPDNFFSHQIVCTSLMATRRSDSFQIFFPEPKLTSRTKKMLVTNYLLFTTLLSGWVVVS